MIKKRRLKRDAFIIPSHVIVRQFRRAGHRGCEQFSSSSTNSASDSHAILTNVTSGFEVSLCLASQRDRGTRVGFICPATLVRSLCFIVQLIHTHETIVAHRCINRRRNAKRHTDKIAITPFRYNLRESILIRIHGETRA